MADIFTPPEETEHGTRPEGRGTGGVVVMMMMKMTTTMIMMIIMTTMMMLFFRDLKVVLMLFPGLEGRLAHL